MLPITTKNIMWFPYKSPHLKSQLGDQNQGFTLVEALVALLILFAMMAGLIPTFMTYRLNTINNDVKTGATALSQQLLDELRQNQAVETWPDTGTVTTLPTGTVINTLSYNGRDYNAQLTYCSDSDKCNDTTRQVTITISHNNNSIYSIESIYTQFN